MSLRTSALFVAALAAGAVTSAVAQSSLPVPGAAVARDVPGAVLLPDPTMDHKVVFDIVVAAENVDDINPRLSVVARYVNTLAKYGVPAEKRHIAVVFHRASTPVILSNQEFKARNNGHANPNIEIIRQLHAAGVKFHVCGQAVLGRNIDPKDILPEIQVDLWALTTLIDYRLKGYVQIGP
jgi:intracellular sulfur oxidation DsrE/DsrF family protein